MIGEQKSGGSNPERQAMFEKAINCNNVDDFTVAILQNWGLDYAAKVIELGQLASNSARDAAVATTTNLPNCSTSADNLPDATVDAVSML